MMSGSDLVNSKFSILVGTKKDYGLAYLKLKFREKGLDLENLEINQDLTELQHNGISKVITNFKLKEYKKEYKKEVDQQNNKSLFSHPRANELNELEKQKQIAKQNNDEVAYNYAQSNIEKIIRETIVSVTQEQWDSMNVEQQLSFIQIKINESKILHDKEAFDYWNSIFQNLQQKKNYTSVYDYQTPLYNTLPNQLNSEQKSEQTKLDIFVSQLQKQLDKTNEEYKIMLLDGYIDDAELTILISRIKGLIDNAHSLKSMVNNQKEEILVNSIIDILNSEQNKMMTTQNEINKIEENMRIL